MNKLLAELKRRNVFRIAMVYAVAGWILMQVGIALETTLNLPNWFDTVVTAFILMGFPIALIFAWAFEMTPEGVKPTTKVTPTESMTTKTGRMLNFVLMGALVLAIGLLAWQNFRPSQSSQPQIAQNEDGNTDISSPVPGSDSEKQSIAVLPFEDFSQDKTQDYFARGISEELLNVLARIDGLRVASRTSAFAFKDEGKSVGEIAEALNVAHVLEGSIRKSGQTLRITAQLIDTANDEHLWSETYDRPLTAENLFQIQDEISDAIVKELKGQLTVKPPEASGRTLSLEAYETYLKAREDHNKRLPGPLKAAEAGFKRVIELDPNFAPAYSGLADTYLLSDDYAGMNKEESLRLAEMNVKRALELAPNSAEALTSAAMLETSRLGDLDAAIDYATRAIKANPNYSVAYHRQALAYNGKGEMELGLRAYEKALALDPASVVLQTNIAFNQNALGNLDNARASAEALVRNHPGAPQGYNLLAQILSENGEFEAMHRLLKDSQALNPDAEEYRWLLSFFYADIGLYEEAQFLGEPVVQAYIALLRGDKAHAREHAVSLRDPYDEFFLNYFLGDYSKAFANAHDVIGNADSIPTHRVRANTGFVAYIAAVYAKEGDAGAKIIIKQLDDYFDGKGPADFSRMKDLNGGAQLQLAKGNPQAALPWIDRMMTLGFLYSDLEFAPFDILRDNPEFIALDARNNANRARIRAAIDDQLANPPKNWVTPEPKP